MHRYYYNSINDNINDRFIIRREIDIIRIIDRLRGLKKESLCLTWTMICIIDRDFNCGTFSRRYNIGTSYVHIKEPHESSKTNPDNIVRPAN